jgi:hypothetical protein
VSDSSTSKYRRRFWILLSTIALVISTLTLAYCQEIAAFFVDSLGVGEGDWDEKRNDKVRLCRRRVSNPLLIKIRLVVLPLALP